MGGDNQAIRGRGRALAPASQCELAAQQVLKHRLASAQRDVARGAIWRTVDPPHRGKTGAAWQVFPNFQIGHAVNNALCYSARPYGADPDTCIFEAAVYEPFPNGEAVATEWEYTPADQWPNVLQQDFAIMAAVQAGLKNGGFGEALPVDTPSVSPEARARELHERFDALRWCYEL